MRHVPPLPYAAAVIVIAAVVLAAGLTDASLRASIADQRREMALLQAHVASLERMQSSEPDWPAVAARVELSVVTVEADDETGSGWVAHSDGRGSDLVTNFHVVADAWKAGQSTVQVRRQDRVLDGVIVRVDPNDDLAVIRVSELLPALQSAATRPRLGAMVMAVGSPLGLDGTVTLGVVSGFRSLEGSDYVQISAPISPGNSGGPVIDAQGRVVAVASAKLVGIGVEALSLAIPVQVVCLSLVACTVLPDGRD